jgi:Short C-terminal domain
MSERLAQLSTLSDLKSAGVLTDAEFDEQKARILNG